ncbi:MAG: hypothetical protein MHM6MM_003288 [Cercozoa sp. M6MM]
MRTARLLRRTTSRVSLRRQHVSSRNELSPREREDRVRELEALVDRYARKYTWPQDPSLANVEMITDEVYDALVEELRELKKTEEEIVLVKAETGGKHRHFVPMLSLQHVFRGDALADTWKSEEHDNLGREEGASIDHVGREQVLKFAKRVKKAGVDRLRVESKLDGIALSLVFARTPSGDRLLRAVTRGDGTEGEDCTDNFRRYIDCAPLNDVLGNNSTPRLLFDNDSSGSKWNPIDRNCPYPLWEVRGELVMKDKVFTQANTRYATARHAVVSLMRSKQPQEANEKLSVTFMAFSAWRLLPPGQCEYFAATQEMTHEWLKERGFDVDPKAFTINLPEGENDHALDQIMRFRPLVDEFTCDGVVLKTDDLDLAQQLGATAKHPKSSIALKSSSTPQLVRIRSIQWATKRQGKLVPTATVFPIQHGTRTVDSVSLHNGSYCHKFNLSMARLKKGVLAVVQFRGDIPSIVDVTGDMSLCSSTQTSFVPDKEMLALYSDRDSPLPTHCPCARREPVTHSNDYKELRCASDCEVRVADVVSHACGKDALNIDGVSYATIKKLLDAGILQNEGIVGTISALLELSENDRAGLLEVPSMGDNNISDLLKNVVGARQLPFSECHLIALGIPSLGKKLAQTLLSTPNAPTSLADFLRHAESEESLHVLGAKKASARNIVNFVQEHRTELTKLAELLAVPSRFGPE